MPTIIPGNYTISHGGWPVSAPSKPGQELTIVLTNPADIKGDVWNFVEAPPLEVLGPIVKGYFITTEDQSAYIALQDPNSGKGGLTTTTDRNFAVRFFVDNAFFSGFSPLPIYTISASGGLVTLVPPPEGIVGIVGTVQLLPKAAGTQTAESQLWVIQHAPEKAPGSVSSGQLPSGVTNSSAAAPPDVPNGRYLVANGDALVPGTPGSPIGLPLNPEVKQAWYLEPASPVISTIYPGSHVLRTDTGDLYLGTIGPTFSVPRHKIKGEGPGPVIHPVHATVTPDKDAAWVFNLEGEYKDDVFTGRIISPDGRYTFINQPPPNGSPYGAPGSAIMTPDDPVPDQAVWTLTLAAL